MRKSEKVRYEVDPSNRLVLTKTFKESRMPKFRYVLDGTFKIDKQNTLLYHAKSFSSATIPQQLKLTGNWSLDKNHNLMLTLNNERQQRQGDTLTLSTEVINAQADCLEFSIAGKDVDGKTHVSLLRLNGKWQADKWNRLTFLAQRKNDMYDELILRGAWEVNKSNQLIYTYTRTGLKTKEKYSRLLTFKGFWDITEKLRLIYVLSRELGSGFDFSVSIAEPLSRGLRYEIGIGVKPVKKKITLFGSWRLNQRIGLLFEIPYEEGKIRAIAFGATVKLKQDELVELSLRNSLQKDLGIKLKLSQILPKKQGEAFIQAMRAGKELTFRAGVGFRW